MPDRPPPTGTTPETRAGLALLFVAAGGLALSTQVVLLREIMVALQGDETAIAVGLGAWLLAIAAGSAVARRLTRRRPARWAAIAFGVLAVVGPAGVVRARLGRLLLAPPPGELLAAGGAALLAGAVLAPPGFLVGFAFTALAGAASEAGFAPGRGIARLYVLESLGSLLAGLLVTFLIVPRFGGLRGAVLAAAVWTALGAVAARARAVPGRVVLPALALLLAGFAVSSLGTRAEKATVAARFRALAPGMPLLAWADTPYQHAAIGGGEVRNLFLGGQYAGSFPDPAEHEAAAHMLASLAPRLRHVLLLGGGLDGMLRFLLRDPVERVDIIEADGRAIDLLRRFLPPADREALADPRVHLILDDPRRVLARPAAGARPAAADNAAAAPYDLILVLEPAPVTLLLSRLSTVEFYRQCAARLAPEGVLVVRLDTAPSVITGETAGFAGAIVAALQSVFPVVRATPGPEGWLVAGTDPAAATLDPDVLARRFTGRGIASDVFSGALFAVLFPPEGVATQEAALRAAAARSTSPSRDARPASFLHALARRQQVAGGGLAGILGRIARTPPPWLAAAALLPSTITLAAIATRRRRGRALPLAALHAIAVTGGSGMAWSLLILFSYQTRAGALYGRIGLLTAVFMLGLALGGWITTRGAEGSGARDAAAADAATGGPGAAAWLVGAVIAAFVFALLLPAALDATGLAAAEWTHGLLLLLAGAVTGGLFPAAAGALLAGRAGGRDGAADREESGARETAADLETADHVGAAAAALVAGIILIPVLGLAGAGWLLAALQAMALAGVLLARARA